MKMHLAAGEIIYHLKWVKTDDDYDDDKDEIK